MIPRREYLRGQRDDAVSWLRDWGDEVAESSAVTALQVLTVVAIVPAGYQVAGGRKVFAGI